MSHELIGLAFITSITSLTVLYYNRDKIWEVFEKISDFFDIDDPNNDYKIISKFNFKIIYCSISGFGQMGP